MDKAKSTEVANFITSCLDDGEAGKERLRKALRKCMPKGVECPVCKENYLKLHDDGKSCIPCHKKEG